MPYIAEFTGREVFCLGCGSHFVIPDLGEQPSDAATAFRIVVFKPDEAPTAQE